MRMLFLMLALEAALFAQLPDPQLTPGMVRTTNAAEICAPSFRTAPFRKTTAGMKKQVCQEYHVKHCPWQNHEELDHLIPLELGGLDDVRNLWVQMASYPDGAPGYHIKDALENELRRRVCDGEMPLPDAQSCIQTNWIHCYKLIFNEDSDQQKAVKQFLQMATPPAK